MLDSLILLFFIAEEKKIQTTMTTDLTKTGAGKRFNAGKIRLDLIPPRATEGVAKVFTYGAQKYGDRNWEKCMEWTKMIASMKRHLLEIEKGENIDAESGLPHIDHVTANSMMLSEYATICAHTDDRPKFIKNTTTPIISQNKTIVEKK